MIANAAPVDENQDQLIDVPFKGARVQDEAKTNDEESKKAAVLKELEEMKRDSGLFNDRVEQALDEFEENHKKLKQFHVNYWNQ